MPIPEPLKAALWSALAAVLVTVAAFLMRDGYHSNAVRFGDEQ